MDVDVNRKRMYVNTYSLFHQRISSVKESEYADSFVAITIS